MRRKFTGERKRIDGERAHHALNVVIQRGYRIKNHGRLLDETGYQIRTQEGPVINLYDTGSITVTGNNRHLFGSVNGLRLPHTDTGVLIVASNNDDALVVLSGRLRASGVTVECAFFNQVTWMDAVAHARKRESHILVLVSSGTPLCSNVSVQRAKPDVYFGLGMLSSRMSREHLTIIFNDAVDMPDLGRLLGTEVMHYSRQVQELDDDVRLRLRSAGIHFGESGTMPLM